MVSRDDITELLQAGSGGDPEAMDALLPLVYDDLRQLAHRRLLFERRDHTLGTTALVHEAYVKLVDQTRVNWRGRSHFFGVATEAMRRVLVDHARKFLAQKRGGGLERVPLDEDKLAERVRAQELLALDEALRKLEQIDERQCKVVMYRFFGGLTEEEVAELLGVTSRTVRRDWVKARGWLYRELAA